MSKPRFLCFIAAMTAAIFLMPGVSQATPDTADEVTAGDPKSDPDDDERTDPKSKQEKKKHRKRTRMSDPKEHHRVFQAGLKGGYLASRAGTVGGGYYGGGWFIEFVPSHDWLEIEVSMRFMGHSGTGVYIPIDVLFKKPFHIGDVVQLYIGAGPSVSLHATSTHTSAHFGIATVFGSYFWVSDHFGFLVEVNYIPVFTSPVTHEFGPTGGFVLGW